jgi:hypothetical protein
MILRIEINRASATREITVHACRMEICVISLLLFFFCFSGIEPNIVTSTKAAEPFVVPSNVAFLETGVEFVYSKTVCDPGFTFVNLETLFHALQFVIVLPPPAMAGAIPP